MSFDRRKDRQTEIMDNAAAISMAQQGQRKGKKRAVANLSTSENASSSTTKPTTSQITRPRFYEADGLKIPLYEKGGKKKVHARLSSSLRNKNLAQLLITVEEYAGAGKKQEFETASTSKANIADWIEEVETRALGAHPKSRVTCKLQLCLDIHCFD
jgi:type II secretory pathway pseudopilin PulG